MTSKIAPKVLLNVDDDEAGRYAKSRILRHAGYEVIDAATGQQAITAARELKPDLILLDVKLPDMSGLEVCRVIKRDHPDIFVLQISASLVTEGDRVRGLEGGADSYLTQPVAPSELVASVRALLRIRTAEVALRGSEAHLQGVLASATDYAIVRLDEGGRVTGWNAGAAEIFGWSQSEALGRDVSFIFTDEDRARGIPQWEQRESRATGRADDRRWMMKRDGTQFFAVGVMTRLMPPAASGFLKILRDQTAQYNAEQALQELNATLEERVAARTRDLEEANSRLQAEMEERARAEEQLRQSQKMEALGQLTGGIAHDFNNMLAVVMAGLGLIERRLARGDTDISRFTQGVLESARRTADLTQRLLAFSRRQPLNPEALDANKLVIKLADLLERTIGENIKVSSVLCDQIWIVRADPGQLENALLNLAVNARDAMSEGGKLTILTANVRIGSGDPCSNQVAPGEYVMLTVTDTGSGMSHEVIGKAFDPFFTTKGVGKGTGLGLSQVFGFVRQSGGHVKIKSNVGTGTTVTIYLPRYLGREEPPVKAVAKSAQAGSPRETIFVVEDEDRVRLMVVASLKELGYTVIQASNGTDALRMMEAGQQPTLLFTDVVMPNMTGRELADQAIQLIPGLKVLFTTGYTRNAIVHNAVVDRGTNLLLKPFSLDQLAAKLRSVLDAE